METSTAQVIDRTTSEPPVVREAWKQELAEAIRDPAELCTLLKLDPSIAHHMHRASQSFPLLVPRGFVSRMQQGDPNDPLLLQVLPRPEELIDTPGFVSDPVGEQVARRGTGLIQKYHGRCLLLVTGGCAVHCRYCFRREFPYAESGASPASFASAVSEIRADQSITEVILSGGDPLLVDDQLLEKLIHDIASIPHVRRLRIHTRIPVVLPSRITKQLLHILHTTRLTVCVVIHSNHAAELDCVVGESMQRLRQVVPLLLNQAVLLQGINDTAESLIQLSERLLDLGISPYYLHLLDPVRGASDFDVPEHVGVQLIEKLRNRLPGYAVPRLARENPGTPSKTWLA
ncbi:MAG: EF-P beta-lysylation protein EpmB [Planctomycetaceae bacterium]|nr:EF-P beta-lysylation protein EpmB [Planctomycetaceae bacterium]